METTTIRHIVVLPSEISEENCSLFQGFTRQLLEEYQSIFSALSTIPHDILELFISGNDYAMSKMAVSALDIYIVKEDLLDEAHIDFDRCFNVLWSTKLTLNSTKQAALKFDYEPIHISTKKDENSVYIDDLSSKKILKIFKEMMHRVSTSHSDPKFTSFLDGLIEKEPNNVEHKKLPFPPLGHGCITPILKVLQSYGYDVDEFESVHPNEDIAQHVRGIVSLADLVDNIRKECDLPAPIIKNDVIVFCPSIYTFLYKSDSRFWEDLYRQLSKPARNLLKSALIRNKGYSNCTIKVGKDFFDPYKDEVLSSLLIERQSELNLFNQIISIIAVNQFCPAIRLPNSVMLHHDKLKDIASLIKFPSKKNIRTLNKKVTAYSESLKNDLGNELIRTSLLNRDKLLSVCDFPIEWISLDGFPIMFTHEISRISSTPGNLFAQMALLGQRILMPYKAFTEILILRSFDKHDPIRNHLKNAIDIFDKHGEYKNINIQFIDINTEDELIKALNAFNGHIVIFDCHGNHGGEHKNGWLDIGAEKVDTWKLAHKCRIPPIVILSACSTHPIDGSHASVANGLFRCGALSVIGTYAPVNAAHAGVFVARLLFRLSVFVPLIIKERPVTWREIVSGFLKMSYSTDILMGLHNDLKLITDNQYKEIGKKANHIINSYTPNWTEEFLEVIKDEASIDPDTMKKIIEDNFQFVDTMLYSQLGRPENIAICHDDAF